MDPWRSLVRPYLLAPPPLLWVDDAHVRWGDDARCIPVTAPLIRWVCDLDGTATLQAVLERAPGPPRSAELLLSAGYRCGHITDAAAVPVRWFWGDDRDRVTSLALMHLLLAQSSGSLTPDEVNRLIDARGQVRVHIDDPHGHVAGLTSALESAGLHVSPPVGLVTRDAFVTVACGHADVVHDADGHVRAHEGSPSLAIGLDPRGAVVGPLVVPGTTSCLRCAHLHRCDREPDWSLRAVQWSQRNRGACSTPPSTVVAWVTHAATTLLSLWSDSGIGYRSESSWKNVAYRLVAHDLAPQREERPRHPLCGCAWSDPG